MVNGGGAFFDSILSVFSDNGTFANQVGTWIQADGASHVVIPQGDSTY